MPIGFDPTFLFELVEGGIKRAVTDLEDVGLDLAEALADGPSVEGLEGEDLEKQ